MIIYAKISKHTHRELTSVYSNVTEYKVNIQMSIAFLCIINERLAFEIKNMISFYITRMKEAFRYRPNKICIRST